MVDPAGGIEPKPREPGDRAGADPVRRAGRDAGERVRRISAAAGRVDQEPRGGKGYRSIFESAAAAIAEVGPDGRILRANPALGRLLGRDVPDLCGARVVDLLDPGVTGEQRARVAALVREPGSAEVVAARADGSAVRLQVIATAEEGKPGVAVLFLEAVSPGPAGDAARERGEEELARRAAALARSNADLENFTHVAAHDLKEPLRGMRLTIGAVLQDAEGRLPEASVAQLRTLDALAGRMHNLLDALLEYSHLSALEPKVVGADLAQVVAAGLRRVGSRLRDATVRVEVTGALPAVRCDPGLIARVVAELVENAVQFNERDEKRITIGAVKEDGTVRVYVSDNGIGVKAEHRHLIFRMYKRLHPRDRFGGGTGTGLAIARQIIERHGGRIWVEGAGGQGSTFSFTLGPQGAAGGQAETGAPGPDAAAPGAG